MHVLCQIDKTGGIKCYPAYANTIMSIQNGNFNEAEFQKQAEKHKKQWHDSTDTTLHTILNGLLKSMD